MVELSNGRAAHVIIGINLDGMKNAFGIWTSENESSKFCLKMDESNRK